MKAATWLVYLFIIIFSAMYVFKTEKYTKRIEILNGYTENFSVERGADLAFFINPQTANKKGVICIYDTRNNIIDSIEISVIKEQEGIDTLAYKHGFLFKNKYLYNTSKLKSGIYFLGNVIPFLVRETHKKNSITVVFPYANFQTYSNTGGKSFSDANSSHGIASKKLSLLRNPFLSNNPRFFINFIDSVFGNKAINYVSDIDLESKDLYAGSKLLILFGNMSFGTEKQNTNLVNYIENGGNILAICSRIFNAQFKIDLQNMQIEDITPIDSGQKKTKTINFQRLKELNPFWRTFGCDYRFYYEIKKINQSNGGYKICETKHPIFKNVNTAFIPFKNSFGNAIAVESIDFVEKPVANNDETKFAQIDILAYDYSHVMESQTITGIFEIKRTPNSGKVIVIGNENWCFEENLNRHPINTITINCLNYLSQ